MRDVTTWAVTKEGAVEGDTSKLSDYAPGALQKCAPDATVGVMSHSTQLAVALDVPSDIRVCIASDSTLTMYASPEGKAEGRPKKQSPIMEYFQEKHPRFVLDMHVTNGGNMKDIYESLPKDLDVIASMDVTIVVCNCNKGGSKKQPYTENSTAGADMVKLCLELKKHKRPVVFIAATGEQWGFSPDVARKWNIMAVQLKAICHRMGVMCVDGQSYYDLVKSAKDGWHFVSEKATTDVMCTMLSDAINAVFRAIPNGSFATVQRLTGIVNLPAPAGDDSAAEVAMPCLSAPAEDLGNTAGPPLTGGCPKATPEQMARFEAVRRENQMAMDRGEPPIPNLPLPRPPPPPIPLLPLAKAFPRPVGVLRQSNVQVYNIPTVYWPTAAVAAQQPVTPIRKMPRWPSTAKATIAAPPAPGELQSFMAEARRSAALEKLAEQRQWRAQMLVRFPIPLDFGGLNEASSAPAEARSEVPSFVETASAVPTFVGTSTSGSAMDTSSKSPASQGSTALPRTRSSPRPRVERLGRGRL